MQRVTPAMMRDTPIRVSGPFIFSPRTAPAMAVTAKVVALVTGTARVIGLSPSLIINRTDIERFKRKGREYSHTRRRCTHSCKRLQTKVAGVVFLELLLLLLLLLRLLLLLLFCCNQCSSFHQRIGSSPYCANSHQPGHHCHLLLAVSCNA